MLGCTHTICTWQSLNILDKKTKDGSAVLSLAEFLDGVSTVIVDEVHQAKAEVLKNLLTRNLKNAPIRWGLTGTVPKEKFEFESIHASLGPVIGRISAKELQDKGVLSKCHVNVCQLMDVQSHSDYQSELKYLTTNQARLEYIGKMMNTVSQTGNTLILVDRISAGQMLAELIPDSTFVSGAVKVKDRKETYDTIKEGTNEVIIATYGVAAVGLNIPRIFNLVLLEPGKSFVRVIQSIGRGVRIAKDKDFVQIWDITSTCKYAKRHLTQRKKFYKEAEYPFTIENETFPLKQIPDELEEEVRFAVLDNSDPKNPDFYFVPMIFLESFSAPAMVLEINGHEITMPVDWHIAVGDSTSGNDLEVLPLTSINDRGFEAFLFNPLSSFKFEFGDIKITNFYNDVKWYFPKVKNGQLLGVPLTSGKKPLCAYFIKDISRQSEVIDYTNLL